MVYLHPLHKVQVSRKGAPPRILTIQTFRKVRKQISFRELWRRIKFLSPTFAFSASNWGALGAVEAVDFIQRNWFFQQNYNMFRYFPSEPTFFSVFLVWIISLNRVIFFAGMYGNVWRLLPTIKPWLLYLSGGINISWFWVIKVLTNVKSLIPVTPSVF